MNPKPFHCVRKTRGMVTRGWLAAVALLAVMPARGQDFMVGLSNEVLASPDIRLTDTSVDLRWRTKQREISVSGTAATIDEDYAPNPLDFLGISHNIRDFRAAEQLTWREGLDQPLRWNFSAGGYVGFTDFRSLWLDEYYRQLFGTLSSYQNAKPSGRNVSLGGTWEYLPQSGLLSWSIGYQGDEVSPPYDKIIGGPLLRGISHFDTWRFGLGSEHVLTPRVRFKQDLTALATTARAWRFAYKAETLWAITDNWAARMGVEGSHEARFHSVGLSLSLERDWASQWFAGFQLRAYRDNGQIISPTLISGAAPALDSLQAQLTLRYDGPRVAWRVGVGPYLTRYAALSTGAIWFSGLYRDRDWLSVQAAWTLRI